MILESGGDNSTIIVTLGGCIATLAGVIVWAVKFMLSKIFGKDGQNGAWGRFLVKFDTLKDKIDLNTRAVERMETRLIDGRREERGEAARE